MDSSTFYIVTFLTLLVPKSHFTLGKFTVLFDAKCLNGQTLSTRFGIFHFCSTTVFLLTLEKLFMFTKINRLSFLVASESLTITLSIINNIISEELKMEQLVGRIRRSGQMRSLTDTLLLTLLSGSEPRPDRVSPGVICKLLTFLSFRETLISCRSI